MNTIMKVKLSSIFLILLSSYMWTIKANEPKLQNMFGTDGIRATIGNAPFTQSELQRMGDALGRWIVDTYGPDATIILGHDTRLSCSWVKATLKSGLLLHSVNLVDAGILPTPAVVQLTLKHNNIDCGIIISASHNPYHDNGLKIIDGKQGKLSEEHEIQITHYFYASALSRLSDYTHLGQEQYWNNAQTVYLDYIKRFFQPNFLAGKKIVLDCAHGATYLFAPEIFKGFGADIICIGHEPNGININEGCGATDVEQLKQKVIAEQADCGFAFDGDGDRVIAVSNQGEIKDGDALLALLLDHPRYQPTQAVIGTIMTNKGFENWLHQRGYSLIRTPVGDKYIARRLEQENGNSIIGGEQSGHIILYDYLPTGDGIFTALCVMEAIMAADNKQMVTFTRMPQLLINVPIKEKKDLTQEPFANIIRQKAALMPDGRIEVRFSGTEAKLRVMVEDDNEQQAYMIGHELAQELQQALGG